LLSHAGFVSAATPNEHLTALRQKGTFE
jgi:hypothetical protein